MRNIDYRLWEIWYIIQVVLNKTQTDFKQWTKMDCLVAVTITMIYFIQFSVGRY